MLKFVGGKNVKQFYQVLLKIISITQNHYKMSILKSQEKFTGDLSIEDINKLASHKSNICEVCEETPMRYFCIDGNCLQRQLVCSECRQDNIYYQHYQHQVSQLKYFLIDEKPFYLREVVGHVENFLNIFKGQKNQIMSIVQRMNSIEEKLQEYLKKIKSRLHLSGIFQFEQKLKQFKRTEKEREDKRVKNKKVSLKQILKNYKFYHPTEIFQELCTFDKQNNVSELFKKISDLQFQKMEDKFAEIFKNNNVEDKVPKRNEGIVTLSNLYKNYGQIKNVYINNVKMLNIEFALDYEKLFNIFHHFPLLRSIKFNKCLEKFDNSFNDYKDSTSLTLEHESLEVIEFDTSHPIDERYLAFFFSYDNFPSLNKLILKQSKKTNENTLKNILNQDLSNLQSFIYYRKQLQDYSFFIYEYKLNDKILQILQKSQNLIEFIFNGMLCLQYQLQSIRSEYKRLIKERNLIMRSRLNYYKENKKWKTIIYSFLFYQKYKNISKRTFTNISLNILL